LCEYNYETVFSQISFGGNNIGVVEITLTFGVANIVRLCYGLESPLYPTTAHSEWWLTLSDWIKKNNFKNIKKLKK